MKRVRLMAKLQGIPNSHLNIRRTYFLLVLLAVQQQHSAYIEMETQYMVNGISRSLGMSRGCIYVQIGIVTYIPCIIRDNMCGVCDGNRKAKNF